MKNIHNRVTSTKFVLLKLTPIMLINMHTYTYTCTYRVYLASQCYCYDLQVSQRMLTSSFIDGTTRLYFFP